MAALPELGSRFAEKYVIESQLGEGAAGVVLSATHTELRQLVAIKLLRHAAPVAAERMIREARAALALHSEHVVRVMDVGRDRAGRVYIVMERLEGTDLASLLGARGPLPVAEAVDYVLQACAGIAEAHARGIVHRDLKPSNLFLTRRADGSPLVKVLDFGISKSSDAGDAEGSLTGPAEVLGSPMYMSPEQVRGAKSVDHRTDIWSLGVICFRLLSGKAPFGGGEGVGAALASVVSDDPPMLRELAPDVPGELEAVVMRCLRKSADDRFATVADLAAALSPFGTDDGRAAVVRLVRDRPPSVLPTPRARPRRPLLVACALAVLAVPAIAFALRHRGDPVATPLPSAESVAATVAAPPEMASPSSSSQDPLPPALGASTAAPPASTAASTTHAPVRPVARPRRPHTPSVVKSAATDDRY
jgi:serine/threonine-protein kinase